MKLTPIDSIHKGILDMLQVLHSVNGAQLPSRAGGDGVAGAGESCA